MPTLGFSETAKTSSVGNPAISASETTSRSQAWKNILQQPVNSWKRWQNGAERAAKNASSSHQASSLQSDSLVSLTSASLFSRSSYPSVISTGTDATSVSEISTPCGITCLINSPFIKPYKGLKNNLVVYLANYDIELPRDVVEQWETTDLDRLKTDLSEVVMKVYRKGVERESKRRRRALNSPSGPHEYDISFELRMSGRAARDAQHVAIGPSIWLICASTWACKEIRAAMDEITWPTLPVEIHEGRVPIPSVAEGEVDINKLNITDGYRLGDGTTLYIHVEDSFTGSTSCGLLCCVTIKDGDTYSHYFSRIGGLVTTTNTLRSSQFGVSTAHGILDHPVSYSHIIILLNVTISKNLECPDLKQELFTLPIHVLATTETGITDSEYHSGGTGNFGPRAQHPNQNVRASIAVMTSTKTTSIAMVYPMVKRAWGKTCWLLVHRMMRVH